LTDTAQMTERIRDACTLKLLGIGAMASERYAPAGLLVERHDRAIMIDGGPGAEPDRPVEDWLVTDERPSSSPKSAVLLANSSVFGRVLGLPHWMMYGSTPSRWCIRYGYRIQLGESMAAWEPEFLEFPEWAAGARVMFADAAGWNRPIRFAKRVGGHAAALDVAGAAQAMNVARLVFAHVGKPTIRALDAGNSFPFGELGQERVAYELA
jgi:hypothetical protein